MTFMSAKRRHAACTNRYAVILEKRHDELQRQKIQAD